MLGIRHFAAVSVLVCLSGCGAEPPPPVAPMPPPPPPPVEAAAPPPPPVEAPTPIPPVIPPPPELALTEKAFPAGSGPAFFDYIAYDAVNSRVIIPMARDVGSVDVLDTAAGTFTRITGFKTKEQDNKGKKRVMGPSAATVGDGVIYVGNRATSEVCVVSSKTLKLGRCLKLPGPVDGVSYVASTKEVWVTSPKDGTLTVLDASKPEMLKSKQVIKLEGAPEGYAVDDAHGLFFTNLEDKDRTLVIDTKTRAVKSTWNPGCGEEGPRGLAIDTARSFLIVACTDRIEVLDRDGTVLGKLDTGGGVDNIDWVDAQKLVYVASGKTGKLTVASVDDRGQPIVAATATTSERGRNAVADAKGTAYVVDPAVPRLLVLSPKR